MLQGSRAAVINMFAHTASCSSGAKGMEQARNIEHWFLEWPGEIAWPGNINFEGDSRRCRKSLENFERPSNRGTSWCTKPKSIRPALPFSPPFLPTLSLLSFFLFSFFTIMILHTFLFLGNNIDILVYILL